MKPAFSVLLLTTLIGAGQGLCLALFAAERLGLPGAAGDDARALLVHGGVATVGLGVLGLAASFAHLGRPERAWRAATMWRSSWLSREVIVLPGFIGLAALWTLGQQLAAPWTAAAGALAAAAALALYGCTAMVYLSIRFLPQWASAWTLANFTAAGLASGGTAAAALAAAAASPAAPVFARWAVLAAGIGLAVRAAAIARNARLVPRSTLASAIGIRHPHITQSAQGFTARAFNTEEFFHGASPATVQRVRRAGLLGAYVVPAALLAGSAATPAAAAAAFVVQLLGLLAERWCFFAEAVHPQNLYYQARA